MSAPRHKRRQILVDRQLQFGLSMHLIGWLYFYVVAFAMIVNLPAIWAVVTEPETESAFDTAVQHMQWFTQYTIVPLALTFVCVAAHAIVATHRIAGPIVRVKAVLREMSERRFPAAPVKLRDKDYFKDVAIEVDNLSAALRENAARERRMNQETAAGARDLLAAIEQGELTKNELLALAHEALDRAERLDRHLAAAEPDADPACVALPVAAQPAAAAGATQVTSDSLH